MDRQIPTNLNFKSFLKLFLADNLLFFELHYRYLGDNLWMGLIGSLHLDSEYGNCVQIFLNKEVCFI